jgi:hypothetical protein
MNLNFSVSSTIVHEKSKIFGEATSHMLVRSSCFSACRSIASAIKLERPRYTLHVETTPAGATERSR